jgi:hypothetical protein
MFSKISQGGLLSGNIHQDHPHNHQAKFDEVLF